MLDQTDLRSDYGTILVVCTRNVCRSPFMEYAIRHGLAAHGVSPVEVVSAGTRAVIGQRMADPILAALADDGVDGSAFRTQNLTRGLAARADLILTAEASHRSEVARLVPQALPRIFTLRQFARLTAGGPLNGPAGHDLRDVVQQVASLRGIAQPAGGLVDDVEDPGNGSRAAYRRSVDAMRDPVQSIVAFLAGVPSRN